MRFGYNPDVVRDRLRTDMRLRNLTIYAQWVSVTAATVLYLPTLYALYRYLVILTGDEAQSFTSFLLLTLDLGPMNLLFPLVPLGLELPHYIRSKSLLGLSIATCLAMPPRYFATLWNVTTKDPFNTSAKIEIAMFVVFAFGGFKFLVTMLTVSAIFVTAVPSPTDTVALRFLVNLMYCMQLGLPVISSSFYRFRFDGGWVNEFMSLLFWFAACLFGVAASLYLAASIRRDSWVSSTLFGGTGIEPMILWLPGTGPSHQSVGNESQEGAVRLV